MSRDGDSESMASRRRVWYYEHRRHLQSDAEETGAQTTRISGGNLTARREICYNSRRHEQYKGKGTFT